jgi:exoribonuclease R
MLESETRNAAMSLAANLAVADALLAHGTGLFRVMAEPDQGAIRRLRHTARALGIDWPRAMPLAELERGLDAADQKQAGFLLAIRRAGRGASYAPYRAGAVPWHAAVAATYAHATAPLRRLADRYVVQSALAVANGRPVPPAATDAFGRLPDVMARAESLGGQIERAAIDLAETIMLRGREGESFPTVATDVDARGVRIQLCGLPVVARVAAQGVEAGDELEVRLLAADPDRRALTFETAAKSGR